MAPRIALLFLRVTAIEKSEILSGNTENVGKIVELITNELETGKDIVPWNTTISGYDSDPRPLAIIPEVKNWFTKVHSEFPYFPIFLSDFSLKPYVMCVLNLEIVGSGRKANISEEEQSHMDEMASAYNNLVPGSGDNLREQLQGAFVYSVNPNDISALCSEISFAATVYLTAKGVGKEKQKAIIADTMARIKAAIEGD